MKFVGNFAGILVPAVVGLIISAMHNWTLVLTLAAGIAFLGAVLIFLTALEKQTVTA